MPNKSVAQAQTSGREWARHMRKPKTPSEKTTKAGVVRVPQVSQNPMVTTKLPTTTLILSGHIE